MSLTGRGEKRRKEKETRVSGWGYTGMVTDQLAEQGCLSSVVPLACTLCRLSEGVCVHASTPYEESSSFSE